MDYNNPYTEHGDTSLTNLELPVELAQILGPQIDYDEVLRLVVEKTSNLARSDAALIMMINPRTQRTVKTVFARKNANDEHTHSVHTNISGWVILNNPALRGFFGYRSTLCGIRWGS